MTTNPPTLTYTLEEILSRLDQKIEKQFAEVNQKMDKQFAEVNQKMDKQFAEVNKKLETVDSRLTKLEIGQAEISGEIKTLEEKVSGIDKRLDNQEFINRGVLVAVIIALISGVVKLFGFFPTSKI